MNDKNRPNEGSDRNPVRNQPRESWDDRVLRFIRLGNGCTLLRQDRHLWTWIRRECSINSKSVGLPCLQFCARQGCENRQRRSRRSAETSKDSITSLHKWLAGSQNLSGPQINTDSCVLGCAGMTHRIGSLTRC
jgi:hypothetical protein